MIFSHTALLAHFLNNDQPTERDVVLVLDALQELLWREMLRLGIWRRKPTVWGYAGNNWQEDEPFYALLRDCFSVLFLGPHLLKLRQRAGQLYFLRILIRLLVDQYFNQREQQYDPQGYALSKNLQGATFALIETGHFRFIRGQETNLTNMSLIAAPADHQEPVWNFQDLQAAVIRYPKDKSDLLKLSLAGVEKSRHLLLWLAEHAPGVWLLGNLIEAVRLSIPGMTPTQVPIKPYNRQRKAKASEQAADNQPSVFVQLAQYYDLDTLSRRLSERIAQTDWHDKVKKRVHYLWNKMIEYFRQKGGFPSQSIMARRMPRSRTVLEDFGRLRLLVREELRTIQT